MFNPAYSIAIHVHVLLILCWLLHLILLGDKNEMKALEAKFLAGELSFGNGIAEQKKRKGGSI